ncbi:MAG TPA: ATPase, T2SS/T4P/T4SS family [Acidimicrobiia bacterium]|nr:ATPase, T2SS/T4P/T4SS family [Acidimicrobiia bacterium]
MTGLLHAGLDALFADPEVSEILLNGGGRAFVERGGRLEAVAVGLDEAAIRRLVERIIAPLGLRLDRSSPMVDARLPDGSRLHAVLAPVAIDGTCVAIRRFGSARRQLGDFALAPPGADLLRWAVLAGWNVLLSGGTGAGKTTLLNVLAGGLSPGERIVTIEETAELALGQPHVVRLEARPANAEGAGAVPVRALVRAALRLRPDRLVVGEVRGEEAFDLLQALNTGHCGSLCTIHANGPGEALARLESLVLLAGVGLPLDAIRAQIRASVDAVVHVARRPGGRRAIEAIAEIAGPTGLRLLYPPGAEGGLPTRPPRHSDVAAFDPGGAHVDQAA